MVRLTDRPDMTLDVYCGCKTTIQQQQQQHIFTEHGKIIADYTKSIERISLFCRNVIVERL